MQKHAESNASTQWIFIYIYIYTYLDASDLSLSVEFYCNMDNFKFRLKYMAIIPTCFNVVTEDTRIKLIKK